MSNRHAGAPAWAQGGEALVFPDTWRKASRKQFQLWADMGLERGTQAEVDRVEAGLVWFRNVRDEFAGRGIEHVEKQRRAG